MRLFEVENSNKAECVRIDLIGIREKIDDIINSEMKRLQARLNKYSINKEELKTHIIANVTQELSEMSVSKIFALSDGCINAPFPVDKDNNVDVSSFKWYRTDKIKKDDINSKTVKMILEMIKTQTVICVMSV